MAEFDVLNFDFGLLEEGQGFNEALLPEDTGFVGPSVDVGPADFTLSDVFGEQEKASFGDQIQNAFTFVGDNLKGAAEATVNILGTVANSSEDIAKIIAITRSFSSSAQEEAQTKQLSQLQAEREQLARGLQVALQQNQQLAAQIQAQIAKKDEAIAQKNGNKNLLIIGGIGLGILALLAFRKS